MKFLSTLQRFTDVKNTQSRINKALAIADHLKMNGGMLDFKQLNELIKNYNQRK